MIKSAYSGSVFVQRKQKARIKTAVVKLRFWNSTPD